jgi:hypothetical protein
MFGKLVVRWTRRRCYSELDGYRRSVGYELVAGDSFSVVVREWDELFEDYRLRYVSFDGEDRYWLACPGGITECFRRVR